MILKAYVFLVTKPGTSLEVVEQLRMTKGVVSADPIYGRFDVVAIVEAESPEALTDLIYNKVEKIPNVVRTETSLVI